MHAAGVDSPAAVPARAAGPTAEDLALLGVDLNAQVAGADAQVVCLQSLLQRLAEAGVCLL